LDGFEPGFVDTMFDLSYFEILHKPFEVDARVLTASHEAVASHVVEPVRIELARNDSRVDRRSSTPAHHIRHVICEATTHIPQFLEYLTLADEGVAYRF